jgi:hypothetical protein
MAAPAKRNLDDPEQEVPVHKRRGVIFVENSLTTMEPVENSLTTMEPCPVTVSTKCMLVPRLDAADDPPHAPGVEKENEKCEHSSDSAETLHFGE